MTYCCLKSRYAVTSDSYFDRQLPVKITGSVFWVIIVLALSLFSIRTVIGQNTQLYLMPPPYVANKNNWQTLRTLQIIKIEFVVDGNIIEDSDKLKQLYQTSGIGVASQNKWQFSRYAIQQSVISLYALQEYAQIKVSIDTTTRGIVLKYELQSANIFSGLRVQNIEITGKLSDEFKRKVSNSIKLPTIIKGGDIYTYTTLQQDINIVKQLCSEFGYFFAIVKTSMDHDAGNVRFHIDLGFPSYIREIQLSGHTAIFKGRINEFCDTLIGKIYQKRLVNISLNRINELYRKKYYPSTRITTSFDPEKELLKINIDEGIQLLLDFVDEKGKPIFRESVLLNLLAKIRNRRIESEKDQLRNKIIQLINDQSYWIQIVNAHFIAKGYNGTEVKLQKLTNFPLHIQFIIRLGTRYIVDKVEFVGNEAFSDSELLREMESKPIRVFSSSFLSRIFSEQRYFSEQTLDKDTQRLRLLYEKAGYPDVSINRELVMRDVENSSIGKTLIRLSFIESYKEVIFRCMFSGNSVIDSETLFRTLPVIPPIPNARLFKKNYENAILRAYQDLGYIDVRIAKIEFIPKSIKPVFTIVGDFTKQLDAGIVPSELRNVFERSKLQLSDTYLPTKIGTEWIMQDLHDHARYTLRQVLNNLEVYEHGILNIEIDEGVRYQFGDFYFIGDTGVRPFVLNREVSHLSGKLFSLGKLNTAIQNLYSTGIFEPGIRWERYQQPTIGSNPHLIDTESAQIDTPHNKRETTRIEDVEIRLDKRKPGSYGTSLGYSSSDGPRGTIALTHRNLFRRNMSFRLRARWGTLGYLYDTTLTEPWLIGRTSGSVQFLGRKLEEDDDVRALQGSFSINRKLMEYQRLNLQYSFRYLRDTSIASIHPQSSTTVSSLTFLWSQDSTFPKLNPIRGILNEVTIEYAGRFLGGESSFIKTVTDTRYYRRLTDFGLVLATALRLGIMTGLQTNIGHDGGTELISFERFWAGGSTTVRGYEDRGLGPVDSTGKHRGNLQFIFNTELRFPIFDPIRGIVFFDSGNVWNSVQDIQYERLPSSVGIGIRLHIGPLIGGVDYAFPLISVQDVPTNSIYLRVGSTF